MELFHEIGMFNDYSTRLDKICVLKFFLFRREKRRGNLRKCTILFFSLEFFN